VIVAVLSVLLGCVVAAASVLTAYQLGRRDGREQRRRNSRWPRGVPVISLDWLDGIPVAHLECDAGLAADVAAWLDAVREGTELRV
jgi:hypothetical protein